MAAIVMVGSVTRLLRKSALERPLLPLIGRAADPLLGGAFFHPLPGISLGEDVVAIVDKLGDDVAGLEPGQMVAGGTWSRGTGGGYAE